MAKAVMMCGISGSGKTTKAREYVERGFIRISPDEAIWAKYGPGFMKMPQERRREITIETEKIQLQKMQNLLKAGLDVVFDSTMCKRIKRDAFRESAKIAGAEIIVEYLATPHDEIRRRIAARNKGVEDANNIHISPEELEGYLNGFEIPSQEEL